MEFLKRMVRLLPINSCTFVVSLGGIMATDNADLCGEIRKAYYAANGVWKLAFMGF